MTPEKLQNFSSNRNVVERDAIPNYEYLSQSQPYFIPFAQPLFRNAQPQIMFQVAEATAADNKGAPAPEQTKAEDELQAEID